MSNFLDEVGLGYLLRKLKLILNNKANTSDLSTVATSGNYNDLSNKPNIPVLVKSDWNETNTSSYAYIQNKPTIPQVLNTPQGTETDAAPSARWTQSAIDEVNFRYYVDDETIGISTDDELYVKSLSADDLTNGTTNKVYTATEQTKLSGIANGAEVNVQSNWNETDTTSDAYILNKPQIPDVDIAITNSKIDELWNIKILGLTTFIINSSEYQVEEGMTWEEWVNSNYNIDNYYIIDNYVYNDMNYKVCTYDNYVPVQISQIITDDHYSSEDQDF